MHAGSTAALGEACSSKSNCTDPVAECSGNPSVCACPTTHYDSNGQSGAGVCLQ
ncbi:hypothetical protein DPMN_165635, partial [Dreissena polymorpha]